MVLEPKITIISGDPEKFFETFIEKQSTAVKSEKERKKSFADFKKNLRDQDLSLKEWRYKVKIKVSSVRGDEKK